MDRTRYEGVLYRINRRGLRTYYARFKVNKKEYLRKIGDEPQINARAAVRLRYEMIDEIKNGCSSHSEDVNHIFERYIALRSPLLSSSWEYNMRKTYEKHLKPIIGELSMDHVEVMKVQERINAMLGEGYAVSTVKQIKDCISGLYSHMLPDRDNIGRLLRLPKFDNKIYFHITEEEAGRLFGVIVHYEREEWRVFFSFLLHGRRRGEVMALRWEDIDMEAGTYEIPSSHNKTGRHIAAPMLPFLVEMLERYRGEDAGLVFCGRYGNMVSKSGVDYHWTRIKERAGLPRMRLHDLQHMIGFLAINSGFSLEEIGYVLGHDSVATTKRYSNMEVETARRTLESVHGKFLK